MSSRLRVPNPCQIDRRRARRTPSGGSCSCAWIQAPNACSKIRSACDSVRTENSGSTRASTGRSRSSSAQKPWMVLTCASSSDCNASFSAPRSVSDAAWVRATSSASRSRSFNSPAAFSVNVTATIPFTSARLLARMRTMRFTSSVVLPVPAAASTTSVSSRAVAMACRAELSASFILSLSCLLQTPANGLLPSTFSHGASGRFDSLARHVRSHAELAEVQRAQRLPGLQT